MTAACLTVRTSSGNVFRPSPAAAGQCKSSRVRSCRWPSGKASWVLLESGLDAPGQASLQALAEASGARLLKSWSPDATHVICQLDAEGRARSGPCHSALPTALPADVCRSSEFWSGWSYADIGWHGRACSHSDLCCRRTKKLMLGVLHGKWVLSQAWLQACLDAGCPVPEEGFDVCLSWAITVSDCS